MSERLTELLDRQDRGQPLTDAERAEAEGLVALAETLSLIKLRAERAAEPEASSEGDASRNSHGTRMTRMTRIFTDQTRQI